MNVEPKNTILIVDDESFFIELLSDLLENDYSLQIARDGISALTILESGMHPDLILLDVMMIGMDGYAVCERLHNNPDTAHIPIIFLTVKREVKDEIRGFELGAVDYITKPISPPILRARVATQIRLKNLKDALEKQKQALEQKVKERTQDMEKAMGTAVYCLSSMAMNRSYGSSSQAVRIQSMVQILCDGLRAVGAYTDTVSIAWIERLVQVAPLYDLGKFDIPDSILDNPGRLDDQDWELMQLHTSSGELALDEAEQAIGSSAFLRIAREAVKSHHEKWDGSGYPDGLQGEAIPLAGRILALVDVYDTMLHKQSYKNAIPHEQAADYIKQQSGKHFDPLLVQVFERVKSEFLQIAQKNP